MRCWECFAQTGNAIGWELAADTNEGVDLQFTSRASVYDKR